MKRASAQASPSVLRRLAQTRLSRLRLERETKRLGHVPGLLEWIPQLSPGFVAPRHLAPFVECLEAIQRGETVRVVCHTPPRGAKTETLLHAIPWWLKAHPDWRIAYTSYNANQARSKARRAMELAKQADVYRAGGVLEWTTSRGGGCIARGVGEGITGQGVDIAIVDDPVKDRVDAESSLRRERAWDWFREALYTRGNPGLGETKKPRSVIVNMARWHPDDLAGRLIKEGWRYICLPAIDDAGVSFWPEAWPVAVLEETKRLLGPYSWASLYQGQPRPRGGTVFDDPHVWTELPGVFRPGRGLDLAYTKKTLADWSVCVTGLEALGRDAQGRPVPVVYVVDVLRKQERAPRFLAQMKRHLKTRWPRAPIWMYGASGPEAGALDFFRDRGLHQVSRIQAVGDKYVRAQGYAAAWNEGRILVPDDSEAFPWVDAFVAEHVSFTGLEDAQDDQVDAGAAMHDLLLGRATKEKVEGPRRRTAGLARMAM